MLAVKSMATVDGKSATNSAISSWWFASKYEGFLINRDLPLFWSIVYAQVRNTPDAMCKILVVETPKHQKHKTRRQEQEHN